MDDSKICNEKTTLDVFQNIELWQVNRRKFVKTLSVAAVISQMAVLESCVSETKNVYLANDYLTATQSEIIQKIQNVLFPDDGNGPSCSQIKAFNHLVWVLSDERKNSGSKKYIIDGINWSEDTSQENFGRSFVDLDDAEVTELVKIISESNWGQDWMSIILTFIFEALALDPIYNINSDSSGWKWLGQFEGTPRPTENITYNNIFNTIHAK